MLLRRRRRSSAPHGTAPGSPGCGPGEESSRDRRPRIYSEVRGCTGGHLRARLCRELTLHDRQAAIPLSKIHIEGLHKTYTSKHGPVTALKEVSLSIKQNEFVTLVGPSGCGKSTLLKLMGALIRPSRGSLRFDGVPLLRPTQIGRAHV